MHFPRRACADPDWGCEARKKLGVARGVLSKIADGEAGDDHAFEWTDFYASIRKAAQEALDETGQPQPCTPATPSSSLARVEVRAVDNDERWIRLRLLDADEREMRGWALRIGETIEISTPFTSPAPEAPGLLARAKVWCQRLRFGQSDADDASLAALLADVRRETIETCVDAISRGGVRPDGHRLTPAECCRALLRGVVT